MQQKKTPVFTYTNTKTKFSRKKEIIIYKKKGSLFSLSNSFIQQFASFISLKKKKIPSSITRMLPDLARFGGQFPRSGSFSRCGDLVSRSGQIWPDLGIWEIFFFKKKKNSPDLARSGNLASFFFPSDFWLLSPRERDSRIFFFAPKKG